MNKLIYRIMIILIQAVIILFQSIAQEAVIELDQPGSGDKEYVARDKVVFNPGYSYTATTNPPGSLTAGTDETIILPADYVTTAPGAVNRTLDYNLPVGTLPGSASVSQTGAANYTIPIEVPPGTNSMQPSLSIVYNSQGGNGILGMKWQLAGLSAISRVGRTIYHDGETRGIQYNNQDRLVLDGNRLIKETYTTPPPCINNGCVYHTEVETFSQITSYTEAGCSGQAYFIVETKEGNIIEYGNTLVHARCFWEHC